jgi:hypothetical protein
VQAFALGIVRPVGDRLLAIEERVVELRRKVRIKSHSDGLDGSRSARRASRDSSSKEDGGSGEGRGAAIVDIGVKNVDKYLIWTAPRGRATARCC